MRSGPLSRSVVLWLVVLTLGLAGGACNLKDPVGRDDSSVSDGGADAPSMDAEPDTRPRDSDDGELDSERPDTALDTTDLGDTPFRTDIPEDCDASSETCNEEDDDCDGVIDEGCPCDYRGTSKGVCKDSAIEPVGRCAKPSNYESPEATCDGKDNDCNGSTDEKCDSDSDDYCDESRTMTGTPAVCPSGGGDCDDMDDSIHPGVSEKCGDGADNDCDDATDCSDSECTGPNCVEADCTDGKDSDSDGDTDCEDTDCSGNQCDGPGTSCDPTPGDCEETACSDGADNDGDGDTDQCDTDCNANPCGSGAKCTSGGGCKETDCTNGDDDDNDGDVDCKDADCDCPAGQTCCQPGQSQPRCKANC